MDLPLPNHQYFYSFLDLFFKAFGMNNYMQLLIWIKLKVQCFLYSYWFKNLSVIFHMDVWIVFMFIIYLLLICALRMAFIIGISLIYWFGNWKVRFLKNTIRCCSWEYVSHLNCYFSILIFFTFFNVVFSFDWTMRVWDTKISKPRFVTHYFSILIILLY